MSDTVAIAAATDRGRQRLENQDRALVRRLEGDTYVVVVADGVGGAAGGEIASNQAIESLESSLVSADRADDPIVRLRQAFQAANTAILLRANADPRLTGMATTLVAAMVQGREAWIANVGDSRAYLVRGSVALQLTTDHSWVADQAEAGLLTRAAAAKDPRRNVLTRAVGIEERLEVDIQGPIALEQDDVLLLCSDGLHGVVEADEIAVLCRHGSLDRAVEGLIARANALGGPDNIAAAALRISSDADETIRVDREL